MTPFTYHSDAGPQGSVAYKAETSRTRVSGSRPTSLAARRQFSSFSPWFDPIPM